MKKLSVIFFTITLLGVLSFDFTNDGSKYFRCYSEAINNFNDRQNALLNEIKSEEPVSESGLKNIRKQIELARLELKGIDFWLRYLEPIAYKKINGPLPVEWENEVFEKFEKPYKRQGAGLTLAELYIDEGPVAKDSLIHLIQLSIDATKTFLADSVTAPLHSYHHFFLANRLFLLNLAAIYTTGFECPDTQNIIPELKQMLPAVKTIYQCFNQSFPSTPLSEKYLDLYDSTIEFANRQPLNFSQFDHFTFIEDYVNPLFAINQQLINSYSVASRSFNDYTLNNDCFSIFDKSLCQMQYSKGIYSLVDDKNILSEISRIGKLLFYDPILSGNNLRSCASCHAPKQFFTDTTVQTALRFDRQQRLPRNTPSLVNAVYNHLLMIDGKHITLQAQAKSVISNPVEMMSSTEDEIVKKVLSCNEYKTAFKKFLKLTPEESKITLSHIVSAITFYYGSFSDYYSAFDDAMNHHQPLDAESKKGFNLFMSKAQCATCHYPPFFNGVKPPYISSEFEVLGVPADTAFTGLSPDSGRYDVNPAAEMLHAFRTGTVRNIQHTKPYMHNGVFNTLDEVIDFYDAGGGQGRKLDVANQTLSADSLKLTADEKKALISFLGSLNERIIFDNPPERLPASSIAVLNSRKVSGEY